MRQEMSLEVEKSAGQRSNECLLTAVSCGAVLRAGQLISGVVAQRGCAAMMELSPRYLPSVHLQPLHGLVTLIPYRDRGSAPSSCLRRTQTARHAVSHRHTRYRSSAVSNSRQLILHWTGLKPVTTFAPSLRSPTCAACLACPSIGRTVVLHDGRADVSVTSSEGKDAEQRPFLVVFLSAHSASVVPAPSPSVLISCFHS